MIVSSFIVRNESPVIIRERRAKGNFYEGLDYIPASTLIGAIIVGMLEELCPIYDGINPVDCSKCMKSSCKPNFWMNENKHPWFSHGYITSISEANPFIPFNPPFLETIYTAINEEGEEEFRDLLLHKLTSRKFLGIKPNMMALPFRNKPPKYWEIRNSKISRINVETITYTHVAIDPITRASYLTKSKEGESTGLLFTVRAIKPNQKFMFKMLCSSEEEFEMVANILRRGVWIGMSKARGYGYIKLISSHMVKEDEYREKRRREIEEVSDKAKEILRGSGFLIDKHIVIIDGVTHTSLKQLNNIINEGDVLYKNYHMGDFIIYRLGNLIKFNLLRPGFVFLLRSKSLNNYINLELTPPQDNIMRWAGFGWLQINHPVHILYW